MRLHAASRRSLTRTLKAAYADGLISHDTFASRTDHVLRSRLLDPVALVGDLNLRRGRRPPLALVGAIRAWLTRRSDSPARILLALDWNGAESELLVGRDHACDIVVPNTGVSRRHARLFFRDGKWIIQDLASTNGTVVNGTRIGRTELRPGDQLVMGDAYLKID